MLLKSVGANGKSSENYFLFISFVLLSDFVFVFQFGNSPFNLYLRYRIISEETLKYEGLYTNCRIYK